MEETHMNKTFNTIESATAEVKRQVAMNKALKQMLLAVALLALIFLHLSLTGCSNTEAPQYNEEEKAAIQEAAASDTTIFVVLGSEVTIDGITYNAGMITNTFSGGVSTVDMYYSFILNRVNNHVYLLYDNHNGNYCARDMIDTGLIFEGPVYINGIEIPPLAQN
jgi:quinol-cytochrome oxidoreductase complex cytochrome b subunit